MSLDINTPRGEESKKWELACAAIFEAANPGWTYVMTPKETDAVVDAMLVRDQVLRAVVEQKSRDLTRAKLFGAYNGEWLVTHSKLVKARMVAMALRVPLVGMLYLYPDYLVLTKQLADASGEWSVGFEVRETWTQATINGGQALRDNAFIDMRGAKEYRVRRAEPAAPLVVTVSDAEWLADYERA